MKQAVLIRPGTIAFQEVPLPSIRSDEVLFRVKRIGVCGSDVHVYHGKHPLTSYPVVQGHEVSGFIERVGSDVRGFEAGDLATFQPQVVCGECFACRHGRYRNCDNLKVMGFQAPGAASEFFAVRADRVLKLPSGMDLGHAAMVEPLAVAVHAVERAGGVQGKRVVVLGAGPIGNLTAQAARGLGASSVMISDLNEHRLKIAGAVGVEYPVNTGKVELGAAILDGFGPDRADVIFECVGAAQTITQAVSAARKGTDIVIVGVFGDKPTVDMAMVQDHELRLIGTLMYETAHWLTAVRLIETSLVRISPLITDLFPFAEYQSAYEHIETNGGASLKVMIAIEEEQP